MDRGAFDTLAQIIAAKRSRRAAVATVLGAALAGRLPAAAEGKSKGKGKGKGKGVGGVLQLPRSCYRNKRCRVGPGKHDSKCDFLGATAFRQADVHGIDLRGANLIGVQLDGADLTGANLAGACLVGANLQGATLDQANLDGAIFCQTTMPDGSLNNDGCGQGTPCCPTPTLGPEACVAGVGSLCSILGNPCCNPAVCVASAIPFVTTCQINCSNNHEICLGFKRDLLCMDNPNTCPFTGPCCTPIPCRNDSECPDTGHCCQQVGHAACC
jgi:hypothetical protein